MAIVKAERSLKAEWGKCRRQIKPKIGQLTDDQTAIDRIVSIFILTLVVSLLTNGHVVSGNPRSHQSSNRPP